MSAAPGGYKRGIGRTTSDEFRLGFCRYSTISRREERGTKRARDPGQMLLESRRSRVKQREEKNSFSSSSPSLLPSGRNLKREAGELRDELGDGEMPR